MTITDDKAEIIEIVNVKVIHEFAEAGDLGFLGALTAKK